MQGERPLLNETITNSKDKATKTLIKAMKMCWIHKPEDRASARDVEKYLDSALVKLGINGKPE